MRSSGGNHLHAVRITIFSVLSTVGMFTTGCIVGALHEQSKTDLHWSLSTIEAQHVRTTYAVAHRVADQIAARWAKLDATDCPKPRDVGHPIDPWGHAYVIACADDLVVMSAGEDGHFGTSDDVIGGR